MKTLFSILMLVVAAPASLFSAEAVSARLQQALFEEEANQNLEAAISAYQSILKAHDDERRLAATARFRLGECYRKLGRTNDAASEYQHVLRTFTEQTNLIRLSEQNLYALGRPLESADPRTASVRRPTARERPLIEEEIVLTEKELARSKALIETKMAAADSEIPQRQALARLRRELASIDDPTGAEAKRWLDEEILLQLKLVQRQQQLIAEKVAAAGSDFPAQKDLLALRRQLSAFNDPDRVGSSERVGSAKGAEDSTTAPPSDVEAIEINRLKTLIEESPDLINAVADTPPLHLSIVNRHLRVANYLLDHGADINLRNRAGRTALYMAVERGDRVMVELLLARMPDLNAEFENKTPLLAAAVGGFKSIAELLLTKGAVISAADNAGRTALHIAAFDNRKELAEVLLAHKADVNSRSVDGTPLEMASGRGSVSIAKLLLSNGARVDAEGSKDQPALVRAISANSEELVELLLKNRADANARYQSTFESVPDSPRSEQSGSPLRMTQLTPLMWAAHAGQTSIVQRLLQAGAEVNAQDASGGTALLWAVRRARLAAVGVLLQAGADANLATAESGTPLETAARLGRDEIARLLLDHKADPNSPTASQPALHGAVLLRHKAVIELLLDRGADIGATDRYGRTALDVAKGSQSVTGGKGYNWATIEPRELVGLLRARGASEYVPRVGLITICRISRGFSQPYLFRGTNVYNQHTLLELVAAVHGDQSSRNSPNLAFPDLAHLRISRREPGGKALREIKVDLAAVLQSGDLPLEWGDVVEIPELDHLANDNWGGFTGPDIDAITRILSRKVEIRIKGETHSLNLIPYWGGQPPSSPGLGGVVSTRSITTAGSSSPAKTVAGFRLKNTLTSSGLLRVSSDLTRVKVKRTDPKTKEVQDLIFNLNEMPRDDGRTDLWLRDGDVIEVPEREG